MVKTAKTNRTVFFATCARLIRQDVKLAVEQTYAGCRPKTMRCSGQSGRQSPTPTINPRRLCLSMCGIRWRRLRTNWSLCLLCDQ